MTKSSPHPVALSEDIDDDRGSLGDDHAHVRKGKVDHKDVGAGPEACNLQEDVDNTAIANDVD